MYSVQPPGPSTAALVIRQAVLDYGKHSPTASCVNPICVGLNVMCVCNAKGTAVALRRDGMQPIPEALGMGGVFLCLCVRDHMHCILAAWL
jgi:hypothetical protein